MWLSSRRFASSSLWKQQQGTRAMLVLAGWTGRSSLMLLLLQLSFIITTTKTATGLVSACFSTPKPIFRRLDIYSSTTSSRLWSSSSSSSLSQGEFEVELTKPLGILLEERVKGGGMEGGGGGGGVRVKEIFPEGSASSQGRIVPGDVILQINDQNVQNLDFDTIMDMISSSPPRVRLIMGDDLGIFDMPKNVQATLKQSKDAFFIDAIVRETVREIRRRGQQSPLGDLLKVEIIVGAGVQPSVMKDGRRVMKGMARFFAIFSTDGVSTYSCNVATTGIQNEEEGVIQIISLSCAKDEGLGQTYDLIREG